ncbi:hypothetical protein [Streptomyces sp. NPDC048473]|uniref:hypothetical protein n=1 Tax=unclassified Streptomyces TaxID=2593676 RepID=UPI003721B3BD
MIEGHHRVRRDSVENPSAKDVFGPYEKVLADDRRLSSVSAVLRDGAGEAIAVLCDRGLLTAVRTAAVGALITHAMARRDAATLAVVGTGEQARLQALWLARLRPLTTVLVHGRSSQSAHTACQWLDAHGLNARPATAREAAGAAMIITTTPATTPVLNTVQVRDGAQVTGIGTDMPHKNELPAALFGRAHLIATDDHAQCLDHGDFGHAVRVGAVTESIDIPAGQVLKTPPPRPDGAISVADLTGVRALDAAPASAVLDRLLPRDDEDRAPLSA